MAAFIKKNLTLYQLILARKNRFLSSGEINFSVSDPEDVEIIKKSFSSEVLYRQLDGLSMTFDAWRFNLRKSNTEPLVRLNVETKGNKLLLIDKIKELTSLIKGGIY